MANLGLGAHGVEGDEASAMARAIEAGALVEPDEGGEDAEAQMGWQRAEIAGELGSKRPRRGAVWSSGGQTTAAKRTMIRRMGREMGRT